MFERFTAQARKAVVLAQEEAGRFDHNYIGTEHILLGLLREQGCMAARALGSLNVTLDEVREQVGSIVGYGEEGTGGQAPFSPRTKKVLELALREALELGHDYIGTEHILLGLVRESEGIATRVLSNLGVDPDKVRREVVGILNGGENLAEVGSDVGHSDQGTPQPTFERFTEQASKVVVFSHEEARHFNHNYIGTEHFLLALYREDEGVTARALSSLNVTIDEVREQVESIVGYGEKGTGGQAPFTSRSKKVLELALEEALQLGHDHIGTDTVPLC